MAVYTVLDRSEIADFIEPFGIGSLVDHQGVADGIENTNYFLTTDQSDISNENLTNPLHHYVLTIFEQLSESDLNFYVGLTTALNQAGLPVPAPIRDRDGIALQSLQGKPALLVPKLEGTHPKEATSEQCRSIGEALARIHKVCLEANFQHPGNRSMPWLLETAALVSKELSDADRALIGEEIPRFINLVEQHPDLPRTVVHGDIFRDNVLFDGERLAGIIDFFSAGDGYLMYDLAVTVNDWCSLSDGSLDGAKMGSMLQGYQGERSLTVDEQQLWNDFLRIAAIRFWVSRLATQIEPHSQHRPGALVEIKDPHEYRNILLQRIHSPQ